MDQAIKFLISNATTQIGYNATFYHNNEPNGFDPATGKTSTSPNEEEVNAILNSFSGYEIDGQVIQRSDLKAVIDANQFATEPKIDDEIKDRLGNRYKVISVSKQLIEHTPISYELQLRQ